MKMSKFILLVCCILVLGLTSCQNGNQPEPIGGTDLQTLVAGTLTAVANSVGQTQTKSVPPTETPTATETVPPPTETASLTPIPPTRAVVNITVNGNTNCRTGASKYFPVIQTFNAGSVIEVIAVNPGGDYYFVQSENSSTGGCWIWKELATLTGSVAGLPVFTPMPTPMPTATSTPLPKAIYTVNFSGLTKCETGWASNFTITNTGNLALQSIRIKNFLTGVTNPYVYSSNSFIQWSKGVKYAVLDKIDKGVTAIVSTCKPESFFPTNPTENEITAEILICPADDLKGACTTTNLTYTPH